MLNCVFWWHIPLEIEYKSRGSDYAQRYHPWAVRRLSTREKKPETGRIYNSATPYEQAE